MASDQNSSSVCAVAVAGGTGGPGPRWEKQLSGVLYVLKGEHSLFNSWKRSYVELWDGLLMFYTTKVTGEGKGTKTGEFELGQNVTFTESAVRHFCFCLSSVTSHSQDGETLYLAAENEDIKELWAEKIQLELLGKMVMLMRQRKPTNNEAELDEAYGSSQEYRQVQSELTAHFRARPRLHIVIIQARNIIKCSPYATVNVGPSSARTAPVANGKTVCPVWKAPFSFDLSSSNRFAKVEVWSNEDFGKPDEVVGIVFIPLLPLSQCRSGGVHDSWYPLGRKSNRDEASAGEIQIQISYSGDLDGPNPLAWRFFRIGRLLPEFTLAIDRFPATTPLDSTMSGHFPLYFPPIEIEHLEDFAVCVELKCQGFGTEACCAGVLLLTNFRVMFISYVRLLSLCQLKVSQLALLNTIESNSTDFTTQIPLGNILSATLSIDVNSACAAGSTIETLCVKTLDHRSLSFVYQKQFEFMSSSKGAMPPTAIEEPSAADGAVDSALSTEHYLKQFDAAINAWSTRVTVEGDSSTTGAGADSQPPIPVGKLYSKMALRKLLKSLTARRPSHASDSERSSPLDIEKAWLQLIKIPSHVVDSCDSSEGPPFQRIATRLKYQLKNRHLLIASYGQHVEDLNRAIDSRQCNLLPPAPSSLPSATSGDVGRSKVALSSNGVSSKPPSKPSKPLKPPKPPLPVPISLDTASEDSGQQKSELALERMMTASQQFDFNCTMAAFKLHAQTLSLPSCVRLKTLFQDPREIYNPVEEFKRMSIPDWLWRLSTVNHDYSLCSTYPSILAVPTYVEDETLRGSAAFRSRGRIPALSWRNISNNCTISRCSQPYVGISVFSQNRNEHDERLINEINHSGGDYAMKRFLSLSDVPMATEERGKPYIIVDARPLLNATANQAAGKGFESAKNYESAVIIFMDIANIHAVRKSLEMLDEACYDRNSWLKNVEASGWLMHINKILLACTRIVHFIAYEDISVLIHCSDGWDRTSQLSSLSMLMLDPFYRTIKGFIVLIEKEWISYGHKFADRLGWTGAGVKDDERSPIFFQFLDCVHQCLIQCNSAFEFSEELLLFIADHLHSGWFGNFSFNSEKDFKESPVRISMWSVPLNYPEKFKNPAYCPIKQPVVPVAAKHSLVLWNRWFFRWHNRVWQAAWTEDDSIQMKDVLDVANCESTNNDITDLPKSVAAGGQAILAAFSSLVGSRSSKKHIAVGNFVDDEAATSLQDSTAQVPSSLPAEHPLIALPEADEEKLFNGLSNLMKSRLQNIRHSHI